jgi:UDPglucose--hexose-1-phosphate uridylyltransferase
MAKYIPDNKTQRWVVIAAARSGRPVSTAKSVGLQTKNPCPFCSGSEALTPPETFRIGEGEANSTGWLVRVVPNKYPITDVHEVIIHSPDHTKGVEDLPSVQVKEIMKAYRERYRVNSVDGHVLIFCNQGFHAGASLVHPHSQLVVVPRQINLDAVSREPINNIVIEDDLFTVYCPEFSQWPFETWIAPKRTDLYFGDCNDYEIDRLAIVLQDSLNRIKTVLTDEALPFKQANEPFVYNYYIYHERNWFLRIIPRAVHRAGFELGTGLSVNVVDPTDAAIRLRKVIIE